MAAMAGEVFIVGAGPGDPGLCTIAGIQALRKADVVLYDALSSSALLREAKEGAELVYVGKRAGQPAMTQSEIEQRMVAEAISGRCVVRLKGGDPFVFGRGGEEALACWKAEVPFTVIPGVTSAIAAAAYAGIPVTHRELARSFMVITGHESAGSEADEIDWAAAAKADTLVILMSLGRLHENLRALMQAGRSPSTPAACISHATRNDQDVVIATLETLAEAVMEAKLSAPAVVVVGEVVSLSRELAWFKPGPLRGRRIAVTRARAQASDLVARLDALGAHVIEAPLINIRRRVMDAAVHEALLMEWDWLLFTSSNAVEAVFAALDDFGLDVRALRDAKIAAIGEATADALRRYALRPDFVPTKATGAALARELPQVRRSRILFPCSALSEEALANTLRGRGASVVCLPVYDTEAEPLDEERVREICQADAITFTSTSTVRNLATALNGHHLSPATKLLSIGPQTTKALQELFGRCDREATSPGLDALVDAVMAEFAWD